MGHSHLIYCMISPNLPHLRASNVVTNIPKQHFSNMEKNEKIFNRITYFCAASEVCMTSQSGLSLLPICKYPKGEGLE